MKEIQQLRKIAVRLGVSGTVIPISETKLYKGGYGFVTLQAYVPVTQNRSPTTSPLCTVFRSTVDNFGNRKQFNNDKYNLIYVCETEIDNAKYMVFERPLPKAFTEIAGALEIVFEYSELNADDNVVSRLASGVYHTEVGDSDISDGETIDDTSGELARLNDLTVKVEQLEDSVDALLQPPDVSMAGDVGIPNVEIDVDGRLKFSNLKGEEGTAATLNIRNVATGEPGSAPVVENVGTENAAVLDITLPLVDLDITNFVKDEVSKAAKSLDFAIDNNFVMSLSLKDGDGNILNSYEKDLPIESAIVDMSYSSGIVTFTLQNGVKREVSIGDLISGLVNSAEFNAKVSELQTQINDNAKQIGQNQADIVSHSERLNALEVEKGTTVIVNGTTVETYEVGNVVETTENNVLKGTIRHKQNTAEYWESENPILAAGELGYDTTNKKTKMGDGITEWVNLPALLTSDFSFATATWNEIAKIADAGTAAARFAVGEKKTIALTTGEEITLVILGFNHDYLADGSGKAAITIGMENCLAKTYAMNATATNIGGWESSVMRTETMATLFSQLPSDLQSVIKSVTKKALVGHGYAQYNTITDKLFLLAMVELDGTTESGYFEEGTQYEYWKTIKDGTLPYYRTKKLSNGGGDGVGWYLRTTPTTSGTTLWKYVAGEFHDQVANASAGVSFAFCI